MDGESNGAEAQGQAEQGQQGEQALEKQPAQEQQQPAQGQVSGDDWRVQLRAKDEQIAELQGKVAQAAKSAEAAEALNQQIEELKRQMADERTEFALRSAGARSVKAAKALLADHDGNVAALVAAEPWLFEGAEGGSQNSSQTGATGLEPAGVAGGGDSAYMRRWERIAGLAEEKE
ncbi:MAG: hypothetical protein ACOX12_01590 [Eggerthellaceae bacterium]